MLSSIDREEFLFICKGLAVRLLILHACILENRKVPGRSAQFGRELRFAKTSTEVILFYVPSVFSQLFQSLVIIYAGEL